MIEAPGSSYFLPKAQLDGEFFKAITWLRGEFHKFLKCLKPDCTGGKLLI